MGTFAGVMLSAIELASEDFALRSARPEVTFEAVTCALVVTASEARTIDLMKCMVGK